MKDDLLSDHIAFSEFTAILSSFHYACAAIFFVRFLIGLLKVDMKEPLTILCDLLAFTVACFFLFKNLDYLLDISDYKIYIIWSVLAFWLAINVNSIYSLIKTKHEKKEAGT